MAQGWLWCILSIDVTFSGTRLALMHPVDWSNYIVCPFEVVKLFLQTSTRNGHCTFLRHYLSQKYFESFEILCCSRMEKTNWIDRVQNIAIWTQGRKENPIYVGYSESKYRLRISLAHPRDCHFAHVQWLPLSIEKPQTPFREIRVMFMFVPVR